LKGGKQNIEDFLRESSEHFEMPYSNDWPAFEQKLRRAIFIRRAKVVSLVVLGLVLLNLGIFGGADISRLLSGESYYYTPRIHELAPTIEPTVNRSIANFNFEPLQPASPSEAISSANRPEANQRSQVATKSAEPSEDKFEIGSLAEVSASEKPIASNEMQLDLSDLLSVEAGIETHPVLSEDENPASEMVLANLKGIEVKAAELPEPRLSTALWEWRKKKQTAHEPYISPLQQKTPWSASINVYPNWTFRKFLVDPGKKKYLHRAFPDQIETAESGGVSLNVGLELTRRIGPITYLNSGVEYISYKTEANFDFNKFRTAMLDENGAIIGYQLATERERVILNDMNLYHYINIPLSISHEPWATDHIRLNLEAGFSYMYFASVEGRTLDYKTLEIIDLETRDYRKQMGSAFMKVGVLYHISQQFNFGFEPTLMYFSNTIYTEDYPFEVIPYSVGMNLKVQWKLN